MKKRDIKVGKAYTNGKGNVRLVIAEGSQYVDSAAQEDDDCLRYRLIIKKGFGPHLVGSENNCTRAKFAYWAWREEKIN